MRLAYEVTTRCPYPFLYHSWHCTAWFYECDSFYSLSHTLLVARWNIIRQTGPYRLHSPSQFLHLTYWLIATFSDTCGMLNFSPSLFHIPMTYPGYQHVGVQANVVDVKTGSWCSLYDSQPPNEWDITYPGFEQTTNNFRFTWCRDGSEPLSRKVVPKTYKGKLKGQK